MAIDVSVLCEIVQSTFAFTKFDLERRLKIFGEHWPDFCPPYFNGDELPLS